jgi:hypothetical protein
VPARDRDMTKEIRLNAFDMAFTMRPYARR